MTDARRPVVSIGACGPRDDDRARDTAGGAFLAELVEDVGEFAFRQGVDQVGGGRPMFSHAHVQRAVHAEGKPARRVV